MHRILHMELWVAGEEIGINKQACYPEIIHNLNYCLIQNCKKTTVELHGGKILEKLPVIN